MLGHIGITGLFANKQSILCRAGKLHLPRMGALDAGVTALQERKPDMLLKGGVANGSYLLAICLEVRLTLDESEEGLISSGKGANMANIKEAFDAWDSALAAVVLFTDRIVPL